MTILAHLSDLHMLERDHHKRRGLSRTRLQFLSTGAALDAEARLQRATRLLQLAQRGGADHILLTGDLTEDGVDAQFEMLAEALHLSRIEPERVTLLPGNHDAYVDFHAFDRALAGPLRPFRATSHDRAHTVLDDAVIVPISTTIAGQWFTRSRGAIRSHDVARIRRVASDRVSRDRAVVVAQHHPPSHHPVFAVEWFDGVENVRRCAICCRSARGFTCFMDTRIVGLQSISRAASTPRSSPPRRYATNMTQLSYHCGFIALRLGRSGSCKHSSPRRSATAQHAQNARSWR